MNSGLLEFFCFNCKTRIFSVQTAKNQVLIIISVGQNIPGTLPVAVKKDSNTNSHFAEKFDKHSDFAGGKILVLWIFKNFLMSCHLTKKSTPSVEVSRLN